MNISIILSLKVKQSSWLERKGRGNLLTFLSKNTLQSIITTTFSLILDTIATEVKASKMFSVLIDTTQDITVTDQCSIVIIYVTHLMVLVEKYFLA